MPQDDPSRTEQATPKRINKAREKGSVAKSQEISKLVTIVAGYLALKVYASYIWEDLITIFRWFFGGFNTFELSAQNVQTLLILMGKQLAIMILPVILFIGFMVWLVLRMQVGALWAPKVFEFKPERFLNIGAGLKRIFVDVQTLIRLGKSLLQAVVIGASIYWVIEGSMHSLLPLYYQEPDYLAGYMLETGSKVLLYALVPMLAIAGFDLWYTRYEYAEKLKMTKDEVKDERKQAEGDPMIKSRQKRKMLEFMQRRMLQQVPKADVIITNPTHFAVALKYDANVAPAPMVLAKGVDRMAQRIKEIGRENGVPIRENKPLAQALYKSVEVGDIIPEEMYQAVASILAQVYKTKTNRGPVQAGPPGSRG